MADITVTNIGASQFSRLYGADVFRFSAYIDPASTGNPVWRCFRRVQPAYLKELTLAPGESQSFHGVLDPVQDILVGNQPQRYYFSVAMRFAEPEYRTAEFAAWASLLPPTPSRLSGCIFPAPHPLLYPTPG